MCADIFSTLSIVAFNCIIPIFERFEDIKEATPLTVHMKFSLLAIWSTTHSTHLSSLALEEASQNLKKNNPYDIIRVILQNHTSTYLIHAPQKRI